MKKRFLAGLMAWALFLSAAASADYEVNVPTSKWATKDYFGEAGNEEPLESVKGEIEDLLSRGLSSSGTSAPDETSAPGVPSAAEIDLSGLSFEELVALREQVDLAIWNCEEWQEVTVPQGVYEVGVDVPAGHWVISPVDGRYSSIKWGRELDQTGTQIEDSMDGRSYYDYAVICSPSHKFYDAGEYRTSLEINAVEGMYISIEDGDVVFTPYAGKPALGFK